MIKGRLLPLLTGLVAIILFSFLGAAPAAAAPQAELQSLTDLAVTGKSTGDIGYGVLVDPANCDDNTPIRVAPRADAQQLGVCQSSHILGIYCYAIDATGLSWGLIVDFNVRMSDGNLLTGYGDGNHIYVLRLPPRCS